MLLLWRELHHAPSFRQEPQGMRKSFRHAEIGMIHVRPLDRHRNFSAILRNSSVVIFTREVCLTFELSRARLRVGWSEFC